MGVIRQKVSLKQVRFFSPIGFYKQERILGNEFFVDLVVGLDYRNSSPDELVNTVNYEGLYRILSLVMVKERRLLESAADEILELVREEYNFLDQIDITVRKMTPPFGVDSAYSEVSLHYAK
ncbi:MAG: dihydroneopterin aldolase [Sphingobacterium sp.]|uniref:dihydroneopterin aldolase n=1 Tax=Sphingobacterium sp. JB170 TaxID=1434842 RepID=UPI00097F11F8|nr:dihydroneopterin aldolase [Sphingobacterium sp. JB170]SJN39953.1 Dihydroneopterin aldolase [Sphingobacterium sp. JB170]